MFGLGSYLRLTLEHVLTYMEDAVSQLLENREDISQYGIARFFTEYFNSVRQGTHILFREFSFVQATPHNRASFLRTFWRCFRTVGKNGGKSSNAKITIQHCTILSSYSCTALGILGITELARVQNKLM
uniref:Centriolar satellite-associated tubulin polyglutamylase complex regulator 1 n=1 Tax=Buteo japonicus TaxID=224669 RepID=A0A8C0BV92_9AVES